MHFDSVRTVRSTPTRLAPRAALANLAAEWWCQKSKRLSHVKRSGNDSEHLISRKWFKLTVLFAICNSLGRIKMPSYYFSLSTSGISRCQETFIPPQKKNLEFAKAVIRTHFLLRIIMSPAWIFTDINSLFVIMDDII